MKSVSKVKFCLFVASMNIIIIGSAVDIFVPSLTAICKHFNVTSKQGMLIIPAFLITYAIFHIASGVYLRKATNKEKYLMLGQIVFSLSCALSAFTRNIDTLLVLRCLQGMTCALIAVISRTLLSDYCSGPVLRKYLSYFTVAWSLGPTASPYIGGILQEHYGWQGPFIGLSIYSIFVLVLSFYFFSRKHSKQTQEPQVTQNASASSLRFYSHAITCGLAYATIMLYHANASFLVMKYLNNNPVDYGYIALALGISWVIGNFSCRFTINSPLNTKICTACIFLICLVPVITLLLIHIDYFTMPIFLLLMLTLFFLSGFIFTANFTDALANNCTPMASALIGFINSLIAGLVTLVGYYFTLAEYPNISFAFLIVGILMLILNTLMMKKLL